MAQGLRINHNGVVRTVKRIVVAKDGVAHEVKRALVTCGGRAREFWPPTWDDPRKTILLSSDPITAFDTDYVVADPIFAVNGNVGYISYEETTLARESFATEAFVQPPPGPGEFVCKLTQVSGEPIDGALLDYWFDAAQNIGWYIINNVKGTAKTAVATFTLAYDDGTGQPDPDAEQVTKQVTFRATVEQQDNPTDPGNPDAVYWTTEPWTLTKVTQNEPAKVSFNAAYAVGAGYGFAEGYEGSQRKYFEYYANPATQGEQVKVTAVSGDTDKIVGPVDQDWITLSWTQGNVSEQWTLTAENEGDEWAAVVDVLFATAIGTITKRVTLHAKYEGDGTQSEIDLDPSLVSWFDIVSGGPKDVRFTVAVYPDGTYTLLGKYSGESPNFPQDWNTLAGDVPDPESFEARITALEGQSPDTSLGSPSGWHTLSVAGLWEVELQNTQETFSLETGKWLLEIRKVGQPGTVQSKQINWNINYENAEGGNNPSPPIGTDPPAYEP